MTDPRYFSCTRLHTIMRTDRCDEARSAGRRDTCASCTSWAADQQQEVVIDLAEIQLSPPGVRQRHLEHRTGIAWKPDVTLTADPSTVFSYRPLPMPDGWDRWKLSKRSGIHYHTWERYFLGQSLRIATYQRIETFLRQMDAHRTHP